MLIVQVAFRLFRPSPTGPTGRHSGFHLSVTRAGTVGQRFVSLPVRRQREFAQLAVAAVGSVLLLFLRLQQLIDRAAPCKRRCCTAASSGKPPVGRSQSACALSLIPELPDSRPRRHHNSARHHSSAPQFRVSASGSASGSVLQSVWFCGLCVGSAWFCGSGRQCIVTPGQWLANWREALHNAHTSGVPLVHRRGVRKRFAAARALAALPLPPSAFAGECGSRTAGRPVFDDRESAA
jgi:hypothetical protein